VLSQWPKQNARSWLFSFMSGLGWKWVLGNAVGECRYRWIPKSGNQNDFEESSSHPAWSQMILPCDSRPIRISEENFLFRCKGLRRLQHHHFWTGRQNVHRRSLDLQSSSLSIFFYSFFTERSGAIWPTSILFGSRQTLRPFWVRSWQGGVLYVGKAI
jgi:hypothetical protein